MDALARPVPPRFAPRAPLYFAFGRADMLGRSSPSLAQGVSDSSARIFRVLAQGVSDSSARIFRVFPQLDVGGDDVGQRVG